MSSPESEALEQKPIGEMEVVEMNAPSPEPTPETASESVIETPISPEAGTHPSAPEVLPIEKKEIPGDIAAQYAERFGIQKEDLEKLEGFEDLSRGQQKMVLENLQQLTVGRIHEEAIDGHKAAVAGARENTTVLSSKFLGKVWVGLKDSFTKQFDVATREKQLAANIQQGGIDGHRVALEQMVSGMKNLGPEVKETPYGGLEVQFIDTKGMSPELLKMAESFNSEGTKYAQIPYEWSLESASPGQREEFVKAKEAYERARGELMGGWTEDEGERAAAMAKSESMIEMQRFMQTCPDAAEELRSIEDQSAWKAALKSVGTERGAYFALGMAGRTALAGMLGIVAAPVVAAVSGGIRGWKRTGDALREQDVAQRAGKLEQGSEDVDGTRKNMIDATRETSEEAKGYRGSVEKIEGLISKLSGEEISERDAEKLGDALRRRIDYTKQKISEGKMVFGDASERIGNQYSLMRSLAEAEAMLATRVVTDEGGDKVAMRLEKMLEKKDKSIDEARFQKKLRQAVLAGSIGAGLAGLGGAAREIVGWMNGPSGFFSEAHADGVSGTEAAALASQAEASASDAVKEAVSLHDVQPGENLSTILEHEYPETNNIEVIRALKSMSAEQLKDAGITSGNPDQIFPGDHIDIGKIKSVLDTHPKLTALHGAEATTAVPPAEPNGWSEAVSNPGESNGWSETISNPAEQPISEEAIHNELPPNYQPPGMMEIGPIAGEQERAMDFLQKLSEAKAPEGITDPAQQALWAERRGRALIEQYAMEEKVLASGKSLEEGMKNGIRINSEDLRRALTKLNHASGAYADKFLGDNDGQVEAGEGSALQWYATKNPGFRKLMEIMAEQEVDGEQASASIDEAQDAVVGSGNSEKSLKELLEESGGNDSTPEDSAISEEAIHNELPPNYQPPGMMETGPIIGEQERAMDFLQKLARAHAPDNRPLSPAQQAFSTKQAAESMIQQYAAQEKILAAGRTLDEISPMDVKVTSEDMSRALEKLNRASGDYADKFLGDNDGQVEAGEGEALNRFYSQNIGFRRLREMMGEY